MLPFMQPSRSLTTSKQLINPKPIVPWIGFGFTASLTSIGVPTTGLSVGGATSMHAGQQSSLPQTPRFMQELDVCTRLCIHAFQGFWYHSVLCVITPTLHLLWSESFILHSAPFSISLSESPPYIYSTVSSLSSTFSPFSKSFPLFGIDSNMSYHRNSRACAHI